MADRNLVIHIRSGDVFESSNPHSSYGQPPLAFYQRIIEDNAWEGVLLVYENEANPVIQRLRDYLTATGLAHAVQSSDVTQDLTLCLRSTHLVCSTGTFLWPVIAVSTNLKSIYVFDPRETWDLEPPWTRNENLNKILVGDKVGVYRRLVLRRWRNNQFQRLIMGLYPAWFLSSARSLSNVTPREARTQP